MTGLFDVCVSGGPGPDWSTRASQRAAASHAMADLTNLARFPGAAECSEDGLGGKGDAWDGVNDPTRIANNFEYRYEELPANGRFEGTAWAASYWPTLQGSSNYRWQGEGVLSPMEKYDVAFHDWTAEGEFSETVPKECGETASDYRRYVDWLGPAASWQATAQNRDRLFDGRDNDERVAHAYTKHERHCDDNC